jgi:hypothetical protein
MIMASGFVGFIVVEARIYLQSAGFKLTAVLVNALAWTAFLLAGQVTVGIVQLLLPVLLLMAADIATRDKRVGFEEIALTLPYNGLYLTSGRALAVLTVFLLLGMELLLTVPIAVGLGVTVYYDWPIGCAFLARYAAASINVIGITFFAASVTKNTARLVVVLFLWWLTGTFLGSNIGAVFPQWAALFNFTFIHGFWGNPSYVSGLYPYNSLIAAVVVFQVMCSTLLVFAAAMIEQARRGTGKAGRKKALLAVVPGVVLIGIAFFVACHYAAMRDGAVVTAAPGLLAPAEVEQGGQSAVTIAAYELDVRLDRATHTMEAKARVALKSADGTRPQRIEFTLRDYFQVQKVIDPATGRPLPWHRQGPYLSVSLPGGFAGAGTTALEISYSGKVLEWSRDFFGEPAGLVNFVASPFTCLRGGHAWYPVVGRRPLFAVKHYSSPWSKEKKRVEEALPVWHKPVPFRMTVDCDEPTTIISNLSPVGKRHAAGRQRHEFASPAGSNVFLLAGPYEAAHVVTTGKNRLVRVYHFPAHGHNVPIMAYWASYIVDYYDALIPRENIPAAAADVHCVVFEAPRVLAYNNLGQPTFSGFTGVLPMCENGFSTKTLTSPWWQIAAYSLLQANYLSLWWPECFSRTVGDPADGMALYMYTLFMERVTGKKFYENAREYWLTYSDDSPDNVNMLNCRGRVVREVFLLLDNIRRSRLGDDGVKQFLRAVYARYREKGRIDVADIAAGLQLIGAYGDNGQRRQNGDHLAAQCRQSIIALARLAENPPENGARRMPTFKLTAEFTPQIRIMEPQ